MAISVDIHPLSSSLNMYNEPDASTAYSLSGHVSVSLTSSPSLYSERPRPTKALLRSLVLTFEGQTELITQETGYAATRLIRLTRELAPTQTMLLSNEGLELDESGALTGVWNFVFNLPIPGWLPPSDVFGNDTQGAAGTRYTLFAEARFANVGLGVTSVMSLADAWGRGLGFGSLSQKIRVVQAPMCNIDIKRYILPPACMAECLTIGCEEMSFPDTTYLVEARASDPDGKVSIPLSVLRKVEVLVSVPEHVSMDEDSLTLTLRMRAPSLPDRDQKKLKLTSFAVNLSQIESYFKSPSGAYRATFPLPSSSHQPNNLPLMDPHPVKSMYDLGFISASEKRYKAFADHFSLLPPKQSGRYKLSEGGVDLSSSSVPSSNITRSSLSRRRERVSPSPSSEVETSPSQPSQPSPQVVDPSETHPNNVWCKIEVNVPFRHIERNQDTHWETSRGRVKSFRATGDCPLFSVRHELSIELTCAYGDGKNDAIEKLHFGVPLSFVRLPPRGGVPSVYSAPASPAAASTSSFTGSEDSTTSSSASSCSSRPSSLASNPSDASVFANTLPAYSQLYYPNGDRKIDYTIPLPLYTPSDATSTANCQSCATDPNATRCSTLSENPVAEKRLECNYSDAPPMYLN